MLFCEKEEALTQKGYMLRENMYWQKYALCFTYPKNHLQDFLETIGIQQKRTLQTTSWSYNTLSMMEMSWKKRIYLTVLAGTGEA